jgi:hypothetical protein
MDRQFALKNERIRIEQLSNKAAFTRCSHPQTGSALTLNSREYFYHLQGVLFMKEPYDYYEG